jgi:hypothetical protein
MPGRKEVSDEDVVKIREDYESEFYTTRELADLYKTTQANVWAIVTGKTRRDCGGPTTRPINPPQQTLGEFLAGS